MVVVVFGEASLALLLDEEGEDLSEVDDDLSEVDDDVAEVVSEEVLFSEAFLDSRESL